jgi:N-acyl-D-amino-acid deacylase
MAQGALGVSTGLDYVPSMYASTEELVAFGRVVSQYGGVYVSHIRYAAGAVSALKEAIEVGRRAGVPVHVSHLYGDSHAESNELLALVDSALLRGIDITFDTYPYAYPSTILATALPGWAFEGDLDAIRNRLLDKEVRARLRTSIDLGQSLWSEARIAGFLDAPYQFALGKDVLTAASGAGLDPVDLACELLLTHDFAVTLVWKRRDEQESLDDLGRFLCHQVHMLCSDGIFSPGIVHPRGYGAFARYLGRQPREGLMRLEDAVRHATLSPARRFHLRDRGLIAAGMVADLVVFDPMTFSDRADDNTGTRVADGVKDVLVGGTAVLRGGIPTGERPARSILRDERARDVTHDGQFGESSPATRGLR